MDTLGRDAEENTAMVMTALAKRAVACKGWRWERGMITTTGDVVVEEPTARHPHDVMWLVAASSCVMRPVVADGHLPDLTDPATLGCLVALVREASGDNEASVAPMCGYGGDFGWRFFSGSAEFSSSTEAGAWVAALEAAGGE